MSRIETPTDWKSNASKRRTRSLIETTWAQIISLYDDKPVAVHMVNVIRSKGQIVRYKEEEIIVRDKDGKGKVIKTKVPIYKDPYYIDDSELLKLMEIYREELDLNALESLQPEEDGR